MLSSLRRWFPVLLLGLIAGPAAAVTIAFEAQDLVDVTPGRNLYRYTYQVSDFPYSAGFGFDVYFDPALYASLESEPPPVGASWDVLTLQADPGLPADGRYDARLLVASPTTSTGFTIDFIWLGEGEPGSQSFDVHDPDFATVESGQTVPEPSLVLLVLPAVAALASAGRRRARKRQSPGLQRPCATDVERSGRLLPALCGIILAISFGGADEASAEDVEIDRLEIVGTTRISRTIFEYTFAAEASNWGSVDAHVSATLASTSAHTVVVEGALDFGDIVEGGTRASTDTFTIRQDRRVLFDDRALVWTVLSTPLPLTTFELIEQALADGVIDEETALVYKVYAELADARLPSQYLGRDSGQFEATALREAEIRYPTLSPATQAILAPLLAPEDVSGVPLLPEVGAASASGGGESTTAAPAASAAASAPPNGWTGAWVIPGEIAIYWDDDAFLGRETAFFMSHETRNVIWPKLTALFSNPRPPTRVIEIFVVETPIRSSDATSFLCMANSQIRMAPQHHGFRFVLAHELMHALLYDRYPAVNGCNQSEEYFWMHEATAKWAEHFVYPTTMGNREHDVAPNFLREPALPLEFVGDAHEYGAYLWFFYISKGKTLPTDVDVRRVHDTWAWTRLFDSLTAIDLGSPGDLLEEWPKFALFNWNRIPRVEKPYREYYEWDLLRHRARESTSAVDPNGFQAPKKMLLDGKIYEGYALIHRINHLGAKYWHFDFEDDEKIRRIRIRHPYADGSEPRAKVQVIAKMRGQDWMPAEDWTGFERKTLCRDKDGSDGNPSEDVEELIVVISNSEYQDRSHALDDSGTSGPPRTFLEMSALGCTNWVGSVNFSTSGTLDGIHFSETGTATNVRWEIDQDRFSAQTFKLMGGNVHWTHAASGTREDGDTCTGSSEGEYALDPAAGLSAFEFSAVFNTNPPLVPKYNAYGFQFGEPGPADYACVESEPPHDPYFDSAIYGAYDIWLDFGERFVSVESPGLYDYQGPGGGLVGFASVQSEFFDYKTSEYIWAINRDPDLATRFKGFDVEPQE